MNTFDHLMSAFVFTYLRPAVQDPVVNQAMAETPR